MADLEESINITRHAISVTGPENKLNPHLVSLYCQLALSLKLKHSRTGDHLDNEARIRVVRKGLTLAAEDHHERVRLLDNLSTALHGKYKLSGVVEDLEEAIEAGRLGVAACPEGHEDQVSILSNLVSGLQSRHLKLGHMFDLEESVALARRAINSTPKDAPLKAQLLNNLGLGLGKMYWAGTKSLAELYEARLCLISSLYQSNAPPAMRVKAAELLLLLTSSWAEVFEIASYAVHLLPTMLTQSLTSADKQHMLGEIVGITSLAAEAAFRTGKKGIHALKILESGRGLFSSSI